MITPMQDVMREHLEAAVSVIDERFGDGFAALHPELVASLLATTKPRGVLMRDLFKQRGVDIRE